MQFLNALFLCLLIFAAIPLARADDTPAPPEQVKCDHGPVTKTYGGGQWLVYGCSDESTLVIVAAQDNPAAPFYFKFAPQQDGYHLSGEGTGRSDMVKAAVEDLKKLSKQDIADLIAATKTK